MNCHGHGCGPGVPLTVEDVRTLPNLSMLRLAAEIAFNKTFVNYLDSIRTLQKHIYNCYLDGDAEGGCLTQGPLYFL